jgi:hypothetical protein
VSPFGVSFAYSLAFWAVLPTVSHFGPFLGGPFFYGCVVRFFFDDFSGRSGFLWMRGPVFF